MASQALMLERKAFPKPYSSDNNYYTVDQSDTMYLPDPHELPSLNQQYQQHVETQESCWLVCGGDRESHIVRQVQQLDVHEERNLIKMIVREIEK